MKVMRVDNVDVVGVFKSTGVGVFGEYFLIDLTRLKPPKTATSRT